MAGSTFRPVRRSERQITADQIERILMTSEIGYLGVLGDNRYPYVIPLGFCYDNSKGRIYFHSALAGHKLDAIKEHAKVCFSVVGPTTVLPDDFSLAYESVVVFGKAHVVDGVEKRQLLQKMFDKYFLGKGKVSVQEGLEYIDENIDKTIVVGIDIEHMTGKKRAK